MNKFLLSAFLVSTLATSAAGINEGVIRLSSAASESSAAGCKFKEMYPLENSKGKSLQLPATSFLKAAEPSGNDEEMIKDPQGNVSRYAMSVDIFLSNIGFTHVSGFGAEVIVSDNDTEFYSRAFTLNFFQQGYSKGEIEDDKVVFISGQYIYDTEDNEKAYMYAAYLNEGEDWPEIVDTFVLTKNDHGQYVSEPNYYFMVLTEEEAEGGINASTNIICYGTNYTFTPLPSNLSESKLPDDAEVFETMLFANSINNYGEQIMMDVTVGVSGDKIYIGGLSDYLPESWLVGTKTEDNTYTFNTHQYIGYFDEGEYPYVYEFAMVNPLFYDSDYEALYYQEVDEVTMSFNEDKTVLRLEEDAGIIIASYGDFQSYDKVYWNMIIGNFNEALTPQAPTGVECYGMYGVPYITFEWSNMSVEGLPMKADRLWCELLINGEVYQFEPEYYAGLAESTDQVYYNTTGVEDLYVGDFSTIYLNEYENNFSAIKSIGVKVYYQSGDETRSTDVVYAKGYEPIEDNAFTPSTPSDVVYYSMYCPNIRFKFDGKDTEGETIPARLLAVEILLDGEPLVFKDSDYYFNGGEGDDLTMIGLAEYGPNFITSLVNQFGNQYVLTLWGHEELPEFNTIAVRVICTGGNTLTYGQSCEVNLERAASPANPWDVTYNEDVKGVVFGAMPIATDGNGLDPSKYGYEIFVNDELFVFQAEDYELDENITMVPYGGFEYNYNFYLYDNYIYDETDYSLINLKPEMSINLEAADEDIRKVGVRAVYTDGSGNTSYSDIINSDGTIITTGITAPSTTNKLIKWYNLQGVEVNNPAPGNVYIRRCGEKTNKVFVK